MFLTLIHTFLAFFNLQAYTPQQIVVVVVEISISPNAYHACYNDHENVLMYVFAISSVAKIKRSHHILFQHTPSLYSIVRQFTGLAECMINNKGPN